LAVKETRKAIKLYLKFVKKISVKVIHFKIDNTVDSRQNNTNAFFIGQRLNHACANVLALRPLEVETSVASWRFV